MSACTVRLYQREDVEAIHAAASSRSPRSILDELVPCALHARRARQWVLLQIELARQRKAFEFVIVGDGGRLLAAAGINQIHPMHRYANLGYWVRTSATGHGVAPAAVRAVAAYAFRETDLIRLEIVVAVGNTRSQRVAEKVGAVREGVLRSRVLLPTGPVDAVMYSLVRPA